MSAALDGAPLSQSIILVTGSCRRGPYPEAERRAGTGGAYVVTFVVDSLGVPSTFGGRGDAAVADYAKGTVASCRFLPARRGETPVASSTAIEIVVTVLASGDVDERIRPWPHP